MCAYASVFITDCKTVYKYTMSKIKMFGVKHNMFSISEKVLVIWVLKSGNTNSLVQKKNILSAYSVSTILKNYEAILAAFENSLVRL